MRSGWAIIFAVTPLCSFIIAISVMIHDAPPPVPRQSWEGGKPWQQEGLLQLVGRIGRERRDPSSAAQMLELLWRLAHAPALGSRLVSMAMELHTEVLAEGSGDDQVCEDVLGLTTVRRLVSRWMRVAEAAQLG